MEQDRRRRITPLCCAALTLCFISRAAAGEGPAHFDETGANVVLPAGYLPPLVKKLEAGERCAEELPLDAALRDALYEENGALRNALNACNGAVAAGAEETTSAEKQAALEEQAAAACESARETDRALIEETEKENRGLRLTLAGIKWIIWAVGAAAGAILLLH